MAANCATKQETRPARALFPKIYSFSDQWIVDDAAARFAREQAAIHLMVGRLPLCLIDFRFLNSPEHVGIASRMPLKAPINADNPVIGHLTFGLRSSCERAE